MKWLTLDKIKKQLRIEPDFTMEDELLQEYGDAAEDIILNHLDRDITDIYEQYGKVPAALTQAGLMLVALSYQHREPVSSQNLYIVPYTFDMLVKPYMKLTS